MSSEFNLEAIEIWKGSIERRRKKRKRRGGNVKQALFQTEKFEQVDGVLESSEPPEQTPRNQAILAI